MPGPRDPRDSRDPGRGGNPGSPGNPGTPGAPADPFPRDLARYLAASTGLPQPTAVRVVADMATYFSETVDGVRPQASYRTAATPAKEPRDLAVDSSRFSGRRRFAARGLSERQLRRIVYGQRKAPQHKRHHNAKAPQRKGTRGQSHSRGGVRVCGIVGYIGRRDAVPVLLKELRSLEYRGYDSAGLAVIHRNRLQVTKTAGRVPEAQETGSGPRQRRERPEPGYEGHDRHRPHQVGYPRRAERGQRPSAH